MPSSYDIEVLIGGLAILAAYGYAAFWAFNIRKGLTVNLYRNQALGIGLVSIGLAYFSFAFDKLLDFVITLLGNLGNDIGFGLLFFATLPLFYWTDQSMQAAMQSDPLERDQFHWIKVRRILWTVLLISLIGLTIDDIISYRLAPSQSEIMGPMLLVVIAILAIWGIPLASSAILLPFAWKRSSDVTFRSHLKWFALAAIMLGLGMVSLLWVGGALDDNAFIPSGIQFVLLLLSAYFLYRSARAIVPLYSFKQDIRAK